MAKEKNKKQVPVTVKQFKKWRNIHIALKATEYVAPFAPFAVMLGVNWNQWFPQDGNHVSVGIGLVMAVASLAISIIAMSNKDSDFMKRVGVFIPIAFGFLAWGLVCVLLSSVLGEFGKAMMATGAGILASATADATDRNVVKEKYEFMKGLMDEHGLSKQGEWKQNAEEQAKYDGDKKASRVRYVPHD